MNSPRFAVVCSAYRPGWVAFCDADRLCAFEWLWVNGEAIVNADVAGDPFELESTPVVHADGSPLFARTPEAFAAFLAGRYSSLEAIEALRTRWDHEGDRFHRALRRRVRWRLLRMRLRRCFGTRRRPSVAASDRVSVG